MKRTSLAFLILILIGLTSNHAIGQTTPWEENFNDDDQAGWTLNNWTQGTSLIGNVEGRDGSGVLRSNLNASGPNSDFETIEVGPIQEGDFLSYEYKLNLLNEGDVSPNAGSCEFTASIITNIIFSETVHSFTNDGELGWHKNYIDLSDFVGESISIAFSAQHISEDFWLYFDNFEVSPIAGFVYLDDTIGWLNGAGITAPDGGSTSTDNIEVIQGSAIFNEEVIANDLSVFVQSNLDVTDILELHGNLFTDGELAFKSSEDKTGQLDEFSGTISGAKAIKVERYIPGGTRAFRTLASAVTTSNSIYTNWQEDGNTPAGFGTHITGSSTGENGFDQTNTGNPSMFFYDKTVLDQSDGAAWTAVLNTDVANLEAGFPYRLFIRGDRNIDLNSNESLATTTVMRARGDLQIGNFDTFGPTEAEKFFMVGNPYQAIVDVRDVVSHGGVNLNYMYVWDPNINEQGGFVTIDTEVGTNASGSSANNSLQPGQVMFVRNGAVVANPRVEFSESAKAVNQNPTMPFSALDYTTVNVQLVHGEGQDENIFDGIGMHFSNDFSIEVDEFDAVKMGNANENLVIVQNNQLLAIEKRPFPLGTDSIQLFINNYQYEDYFFKAEVQNLPEDKAVFVKDNYLNTLVEIDENTTYAFNVDASIPESTSIFRFALVFENETLGVTNYLSEAISLYPVPVNDVLHIANSLDTDFHISVYNLLGQQVVKSVLVTSNNQSITMQGLQTGVYIVRISDGVAVFNQQIIKK